MTDTAILDTRKLIDALKLVDVVREAHFTPLVTFAVARFGANPHMVATDLDQELTVQLQAEGAAEFAVTIDPAVAVTALGNSSGPAMISSDSGRAHIATGRVTLRGPKNIEAGDFPDMKTGDPASNFTISESALHEALQAVRFAISREETRYYLNGVFLTSVDGEMAMVATDGHRMARHLMAQGFDGPHVIIPAQTVKTLTHLLKRNSHAPISVTISIVGPGKGRLGMDTHAITFEGAGWTLKSRCIDGTFPDWEIVLRKATRDAIARKSIIAKVTQAHVSRLPKNYRFWKCRINPGASVMQAIDDAGEDTVDITIEGIGKAFYVNIDFLRQLVGAVGDVELIGCAPDCPFIAKPKNPRTIAVQMPMGVKKKKG